MNREFLQTPRKNGICRSVIDGLPCILPLTSQDSAKVFFQKTLATYTFTKLSIFIDHLLCDLGLEGKNNEQNRQNPCLPYIHILVDGDTL